MTTLVTTAGQSALPRYFPSVFKQAKAIDRGRIDVILPDGRRFRGEGRAPGPVAEVRVHEADLFARMLREGDLGFSEAYLDGWWSTPDLQAVMDLVHANAESILYAFPGIEIVRAYEKLRFWFLRNSRRQAAQNVARHYDLGNDFYALWLDETMTYSSALFATGQESTEAAQQAKYAAMIEAMGVGAGDHVLEIGCGWGGFAEYAAREHGLSVTGLTISRAQHDYARARIDAAGLSDRVDIRLRDYRDEQGCYDGVASIEMFEAVGERYWPTYFASLKGRLKPGRRAALQVITVNDNRFEGYRRRVDFVQKHVFPGGMLPSPSALRREIESAGLKVLRSMEFGRSYDQTLRRWHESFNARWDEIARMGFDDRFRRMWNFYLTSCAASFSFGICDVRQITVRA